MRTIEKFIKGFFYAAKGIKYCLKELNFRIHILVALVAVVLATLLKISMLEWLAVIIVITIVITLEMLNSALEKVMDHLRDDLNLPYEKAGTVKDIAAGAVLVSATGAAIVGIIVFLPKLIQF